MGRVLSRVLILCLAGALIPACDGGSSGVGVPPPFGIRITAIGPDTDECDAIALQADGKIVISGWARTQPPFPDMLVARYTPNGSLDPTFGGDGIVITQVGTGASRGRDLAIQADGKIVVIGESYDAGSIIDFTVVRYNVDGSLDTTFDPVGNDGIVTTSVGTGYAQAFSVALQADGRIVVVGVSNNGSDTDFAVVRYNPDGSLDTSFDPIENDGIVTTPIGGAGDVPYEVTVQTDGKIVVVGDSSNGIKNEIAIVRYNSDGSLDSTFDPVDNDGIVITSIPVFGSDRAESVAIQADGKLVVAGHIHNGTDPDFAILRYNPDGSLDTTFDPIEKDGIVTTPTGIAVDYGMGVVLQADGRIIVAGSAWNVTDDSDFAVVRYNADGSLDTTFDPVENDGIVITPLGDDHEFATGVVILADGTIVVAGRTRQNAQFDVALVRYNSDGSLP